MFQTTNQPLILFHEDLHFWCLTRGYTVQENHRRPVTRGLLHFTRFLPQKLAALVRAKAQGDLEKGGLLVTYWWEIPWNSPLNIGTSPTWENVSFLNGKFMGICRAKMWIEWWFNSDIQRDSPWIVGKSKGLGACLGKDPKTCLVKKRRQFENRLEGEYNWEKSGQARGSGWKRC